VFPLRGTVGRCLQDRGLTVTLRICEDLESFEATTAVEVTSPARPWLGAVQLTDDGDLDWECDYRAAFHGDPSQLADVIAAILHVRPGTGCEAFATRQADGPPDLGGREGAGQRLPKMPVLPKNDLSAPAAAVAR